MIFKFNISVNNYNNGPKIQIGCNEKVLYRYQLTEAGPQQIEFSEDMQLPNTLYIEHYDKNMKRDTKVQEGKIIEDKGFSLQSIEIDNIALDKEIFDFPFQTEHGKTLKKNNYFGLNGKMLIHIDEDNLPSWFMKLQQSFINQNVTFDYDLFKNEIFDGKIDFQLEY